MLVASRKKSSAGLGRVQMKPRRKFRGPSHDARHLAHRLGHHHRNLGCLVYRAGDHQYRPEHVEIRAIGGGYRPNVGGGPQAEHVNRIPEFDECLRGRELIGR